MFLKIIKNISPPIIFKFFKFFKSKIIKPSVDFKREEILFGGDDKLFKKLLSESKIYGEYGCGQSTLWVEKNTKSFIISVDTSIEWTEKVKKLIIEKDRLLLKHIDCGPVVNFGRPRNYTKKFNFKFYTNFIWENNSRKPDTILIDGRFRVACFLKCLLEADPFTKIIFDDYVNREHYHIIEEYLKPKEFCGRQALFIRPDDKEIEPFLEKIKLDFYNFQNVMD